MPVYSSPEKAGPSLSLRMTIFRRAIRISSVLDDSSRVIDDDSLHREQVWLRISGRNEKARRHSEKDGRHA
jgi:hypothetical protein